MNIGTFYLTRKVDTWWTTTKYRRIGLEFTWSKFLEELRAKFHLVTIQRHKEKEFTELRMTGSMTIMQYAIKFTKLSRIVFELLAYKRMNMKRFDEGLAFYIHNQLVS